MKRKVVLSILFAVVSLLLTDYFVGVSPHKIKQQSPSETVVEDAPIMQYGIPVDSFCIKEGRLRYGQTIGKLLLSRNVPPHLVNSLSLSDSFNPKAFKAGHRYKLFLTKDSLNALRYLVYEKNKVEYIVFDIADTLRIYPFQKDIRIHTRLYEATIESSLWKTMKNNQANPLLALELSDIFAWTVDFFGLHPGDKFRVLYDELLVDSTSVGLGTIHAAWFEHRGERFYAFRFAQDSVPSYWDEQGNSLRKAFLKAPLHFTRISSRFSRRRFHPVLRIYRPHTGVDYAAPTGTPVMALGDGVIIARGYNRAAGNYVKIRHNSVYTTGYNHLSRFGKGIRKGVRVKQGQVIGYVGRTGYATGPHLDLRFWKNGRAIDPLKVKSPPVEPISPENKPHFFRVKDSLLTILNSPLSDSLHIAAQIPESAVATK